MTKPSADPLALPAGEARPTGSPTTETYRAYLEDLTEWVCRFQSDGTILYVNDAFVRRTGYA